MKFFAPNRKAPLAGVLVLAAAYGLWGLRWGLPSRERADIVLAPQERTPEFYAKIEKARDDLYEKIGGNVAAYFGRTLAPGELAQSPVTLLNAYSSYLVKTHELDESAVLVMVSRLNPLQGRWFPHAFFYGGAYLFPLAAYLGALHVLKCIHLVPSASYYYANPDAMASIYVAIRAWSLIGYLVAVTAVFYIGRRLAGAECGAWAAAYFALLPCTLSFAKVAKPHTWTAAWTLWALFFCLAAKEERDDWAVLGAGLLWGLALGTAMTQVIFAPFFLWICWPPAGRFSWRRAVILGAAAGGVYLASNFYLLGHFQEFLEEQHFLHQYSPFGLRAGALWDFWAGTLRHSLGWELWLLSMAGAVTALWRNRPPRLRALVLLGCVSFIYSAFQMQAQHGMPVLSRLFIALLGGCCLLVSVMTEGSTWGETLRTIILFVLMVKSAFLVEHIRSDHFPSDNASEAAAWVQGHIPAHSIILHGTLVPQTDTFPALRFSNYRLASLKAIDLDQPSGDLYALVPGEDIGDEWRAILIDKGFTQIQRFADSPLQKLGYKDLFIRANFPVEIYKRDGQSS